MFGQDLLQHAIQAGKLRFHVDVVGADDVVDQEVERGGLPVRLRRRAGSRVSLAFDFLQHGGWIETARAAGLVESLSAAATIIDAEPFENLCASRHPGGQFAHRDFRRKCVHVLSLAPGGSDVGDWSHGARARMFRSAMCTDVPVLLYHRTGPVLCLNGWRKTFGWLRVEENQLV